MELTVCTVSFNSATEILNNIDLVRRLNPDNEVRWIVADNSPEDSPERLREAADNLDVIPGAGSGYTPHYHHTVALGKAIALSRTRFVLVLDPDFFIIRPNWVSEMATYMQTRGLSILGVPWHPQRTDKYRYFPAVHCALFDTTRFPREDIDFRPDYPNGANDPEWPGGYREDECYFTVNPITRWLARLPSMQPRRTYYIDTGGRLYKQYVKDPGVKFELIEPVYDAAAHRANLTAKTRLLERILPDELCYLPKRYRDNANEGFLHRWTDHDLTSQWEQFVWQGEPFGFHMRRNAGADKRSQELERELANRLVSGFPGNLA